jgi:hypothetical protein
VADLRLELPTVTCVMASSDACDAAERSSGVSAIRVTDREVMIVGDADVAAIRAAIDDRALVSDVSDGWSALVIEGTDAPEAFARLSELRLPASGWIQGDVARVAAKVLVEPGRLTLLVPAHLGAHVEERIRTDAAEVLT